jgi:hypothetical protein
VDNVQLACATHNGYLAEREYGKEVIERHKKNRRSASRVSEPVAVYNIPEPSRSNGRMDFRKDEAKRAALLA